MSGSAVRLDDHRIAGEYIARKTQQTGIEYVMIAGHDPWINVVGEEIISMGLKLIGIEDAVKPEAVYAGVTGAVDETIG